MIAAPLRWAARHGRACLIAGLLAGFLFPGAALTLKPWLPEIVALMIFVAAFRIGARAAWGGLKALPNAVRTVLLLQCALPVLTLAVCLLLGIAALPAVFAVILMMSAPSISGSPNLTILLGHDPAPALRLMILGTAALPLTVLPVLWLLPGIEGPQILLAGLRLLLTIAAATALAFVLRHILMREVSDPAREALDGLGALLMAIAVVGLLAGLSPTLRADPSTALAWIALAFTVNIGLQLLGLAVFGRAPDAVPKSIIAGNRNVALFLVALPASATDPILSFIGGYQLPMYTTPIVMAPIYKAWERYQTPT
ncbi:hypothetical protein [Ovoidimarina sediminis]|uniref:hypothetical protein n=1 Tax=Ovoidimarina sediminis TaxID=3079856 RepID=UPI002912D2AB|nr:hypothetical protein [Rhodophyticola sp. MJ-SS7]MDU8942491.1 hypothetical protein [Rhodophyticola sp. MJ-SS7]